MLHNVERDDCFAKESCRLLIKFLLSIEFIIFYNEICQKV
jgi:hypothetical protein